MSPSMYGGAVRDGVTPAYPVFGPTVIQLRGEHDLSSVVSLSETISPIARRILEVCELDDLIEPNSHGAPKRPTSARCSCGIFERIRFLARSAGS